MFLVGDYRNRMTRLKREALVITLATRFNLAMSFLELHYSYLLLQFATAIYLTIAMDRFSRNRRSSRI